MATEKITAPWIGIEEPAFTAQDAPPEGSLNWKNYPQIPPILLVRRRLA